TPGVARRGEHGAVLPESQVENRVHRQGEAGGELAVVDEAEGTPGRSAGQDVAIRQSQQGEYMRLAELGYFARVVCTLNAIHREFKDPAIRPRAHEPLVRA